MQKLLSPVSILVVLFLSGVFFEIFLWIEKMLWVWGTETDREGGVYFFGAFEYSGKLKTIGI